MAEKSSLTALARQQLELARQTPTGRSAHTVFGGHEHVLRQTLIALVAGQGLNEHESPGEATLHVLQGGSVSPPEPTAGKALPAIYSSSPTPATPSKHSKIRRCCSP